MDNLRNFTLRVIESLGSSGPEIWTFTAIILITTLFFLTLGKHYITNSSKPGGRWLIISNDTAILALFSLTILLLRFPGFARGQLNVDESQWMAEAITLQEDPRYYLSTICFGPLVSYPIVFMTWFGATVSYGVVKLLATIIWIAVAIFTFKSFKNFFNSSLAGVLTLPLVTVVSLFTFQDYVAYNAEHAPIFLISLGLYLFSRVYKKADKARPIDYYLVGFILGCVPFSKIQAAPVAFAMGVYLIYYFGINKSRYLVAGAFSFPLLVLGYLLTLDLTPVFMNSTLGQISYAQDHGKLNVLSFIEKLSHYPSYILEPRNTKYYFRTQLFFILLTFIPLFLFRKHLLSNYLKLIGLAVLYLVVSLYVVYQSGHTFDHYILLLVAPVSFLSGILIGSLFRTDPVMGLSSKSKTILLGVYLIAASIIPCFFVLETGNVALVGGEYNAAEGFGRNQIVRVIQKYKKENDRLSVWGWANHYNVLAGLPQGTRYTNSQWQIEPFPQQSNYLDIYVSDLEKNKPAFFMDAVAPGEFHYKDASVYGYQNFPQIKAFIDKHYNYVDKISGVRIYVIKDRKVDQVLVEGVTDIVWDTSNINDIKLPPEKEDIQIDFRKHEGPSALSFRNAWAYVGDGNSLSVSTWIVLQSDSKRYIFPTRKVKRYDLVHSFSGPYLHAGFDLSISKAGLNRGIYKVGVLFTEGYKVRGFKFTNKKLVRNYSVGELRDGHFEVTNNLKYDFQIRETNEFYNIKNAYAFVEGHHPRQKVFVILKSQEKKYIFATKSEKRRELSKLGFKMFMQTGFTFKINRDKLEAGNYQLGILITQGNEILGFQYTNKKISKEKTVDWSAIQLPEETKNIESHLTLTEDDHSFKIKDGWALIKGVSSYTTEIYLVLKSTSKTKILKTESANRPEPSTRFGKNYYSAGFNFKIQKDQLEKGRYTIGLLLVNFKKQKVEGFQFTSKRIKYEDTYIGDYVVGQLMNNDLQFPETKGVFKSSLKLEKDENNISINNGWAFIEGKNAKEQKVYVVLNAVQGSYIFETNKKQRHELAEIFGKQYVGAGFTFEVKRKKLQPGKYLIGIMIAENDKIIDFKFTKMYLEI